MAVRQTESPICLANIYPSIELLNGAEVKIYTGSNVIKRTYESLDEAINEMVHMGFMVKSEMISDNIYSIWFGKEVIRSEVYQKGIK